MIYIGRRKMGKSLNGKELGKGISQRKDGRYQARFTDRFGKRQTIYAKSLNEVRNLLRNKSYEDSKELNIVDSNMTLDEWYDVWVSVYKQGCADTSLMAYDTDYKRIKKELGWRELQSITPIILQSAFNNLKSDQSRIHSKRVLVDMYERAIDVNLIQKNIASSIITSIDKAEQKERRVMSEDEMNLFLRYAITSPYYDLFIFALNTGMRVGELAALQWEDIDLKNNCVHVNHTMAYSKDNAFSNDFHCQFHPPKTKSSKRKIPLTVNSYNALMRQKKYQNLLLQQGYTPPKDFKDLVFVTKKYTPIQSSYVAIAIEYTIKRIRNDGYEFEKISSHTFRHTFATRAVERGMNFKTLQKILGHSSLSMTMDLYAHVVDDTLYKEMEKMNIGESIGVKLVSNNVG